MEAYYSTLHVYFTILAEVHCNKENAVTSIGLPSRFAGVARIRAEFGKSHTKR